MGKKTFKGLVADNLPIGSFSQKAPHGALEGWGDFLENSFLLDQNRNTHISAYREDFCVILSVWYKFSYARKHMNYTVS